ncbi:hypothetical protein CLOM_g20703 [Closterium sp. NIES-68]|nr:hypothetical protein CLOM_g20703 [Closterium sp. NIES-68]GJP82410.1 hypothetical protein CLOP_g12672 [Closterium sp. NIES-67]
MAEEPVESAPPAASYADDSATPLLAEATGSGAQAENPEGESEGKVKGENPQGESEDQGEGKNPTGGSEGPGKGENPAGGSEGQGEGENPAGGSEGQGEGENPAGGSEGQGEGEKPAGGSEGQGDGENPAGGSEGQGEGERPELGGDSPGSGGGVARSVEEIAAISAAVAAATSGSGGTDESAGVKRGRGGWGGLGSSSMKLSNVRLGDVAEEEAEGQDNASSQFSAAPAGEGEKGMLVPPPTPRTPRPGEAGWRARVGRGESWSEALLLPLTAGLSDFDVVDPKHASSDALMRWRRMALVRNATRRFRYTADLQQRREQESKPPTPKMSTGLSRFRGAAKALKAVARFKSVLPRLSDAAYRAARAEGFSVSAKQLATMVGGQDTSALDSYGSAQGVARLLGSNVAEGIGGGEGDLMRRRKVYGANTFPEQPPKTFVQFVWDAMQDMTLWILAVCAVVSLLVGIITEGWQEGWYDGVGILMSILLVVFVTATSDYRQSLQFQMLDREKKKVAVEVVRGGVRQKVSIYDLVAGDVIVLSTGDIVPADAVFIGGHSLVVDESSMTGESVPAYKGKDAPFFLAGTKVQDGHGTALVVGVGMNTEWGQLIAKLTDSGDDETPLQVKLSGVATLIGRVGLYVALVVFVVLLSRLLLSTRLWDWSFHHTLQVVDYFAVAVTIVVVAVPEGLPLAVTLSLAFAMKKMMKDKALVRKLAACETMGSATTICSDKTGTLTANQMTVVQAWVLGRVRKVPLLQPQEMLDKEEWKLPASLSGPLLQNVFINTSGDVQLPTPPAPPSSLPVVLGTPTEQAILTWGMHLASPSAFAFTRSSATILKLEPFNSQRKRMAAAVRLPDGGVRVMWKGAAEIILACCSHAVVGVGDQAEVVALDHDALGKVVEDSAAAALRTLSLAYRDLSAGEVEKMGLVKGGEWVADVAIPDEGLTLMAVVGIKDPLRPEVPRSVMLCKRAGIMVRMVTGDNLSTAIAIARECGILTADGVAVEGPKFRVMGDEERRELVPKLQVMARSSPTDKHLLVSLLREMGEVVAVTGDGTNDAPALKEAEIGLAMGIAGTEVAKESADVIVMDDNFSSVVNVAKWGRSVYTNIQKFVQFQLTVNIVALITNFVSACITGTAPLTAVQLLWVNLIMDTLGALALATEPPKDSLMHMKPVGRRTPFITPSMWRNIAGQVLFQLLVLALLHRFAAPLFGLQGALAGATKRTLVFNTFVFCQLFNEINSRELDEINVLHGMHQNAIFLAILLFSTVFQVCLVQYLGKFASTVPLTPLQFAACIFIASLSLPVAAAVKLIEVPKQSVVAMGRLTSSISAHLQAFFPEGQGQGQGQEGGAGKEVKQD